MHDPSRWADKIWFYYPINYPPEKYYNLMKGFIDKVASLGEVILEMGCGSALASITIKQLHPEQVVMACDINPKVIEYARERIKFFKLNIDVANTDAFTTIYSNIDVLFTEGLLEHYDPGVRIKMLQHWLGIAKYIVIQVPTEEDLNQGGGYMDEQKHSYQCWSNFIKNSFNVIEEFGDIYKYNCVLTKNE